MSLDKQSILEMMKLNTEEVDLGNGSSVIVSEIGAGDLIAMYDKVKDDKGEINMAEFTFVLLTSTIVDETGNRIFTDEEVSLIKRWPRKLVEKISLAAKKINGLLGDEGNDSEPTTGGSTDGELQQPLDFGTQTT